MKVFNTANSSHLLIVTPRLYAFDVVLILRHELTDKEYILNDLIATKDNGYLKVPFTFTFKEGASYEMTLNDINNNLLWRGKGYATSETDLENYKLING